MISGKEALIALANGEEVEFQEPVKDKWIWMSAKHLTIENILNHTATYTIQNSPSCVEHNSYSIQFRLKPQTITINGIEVPKPDYIVDTPHDYDGCWEINIGGAYYLFKTEQNYKQVVEALRQIFK